MKHLKLADNNEIPILGFGTYELTGKTAQDSVTTALQTGYRHIDTAEIYGNQLEVGTAIKNSGVARKDLFVTSKVWRSNLKPNDVFDACRNTLDELQLDFLDLYLIHWPNSSISIEATLEALTKLKSEGLIKSIGVSNFTIRHIDEVLEASADVVMNQIELHPSLFQKNLIEHCKENNITITAYSPIAQGDDLKIQEVKDLADKHNVSPAQIILAWIMEKDIVAIPRSSSEAHIKDNFESQSLKLDDEDIATMDNLDTRHRIIDPGFAEFDYEN